MGTTSVTPETVAVLTAAVQQMYGKNYIAVRVQPNNMWTIASRLRL